jgi:hypothetical protein
MKRFLQSRLAVLLVLACVIAFGTPLAGFAAVPIGATTDIPDIDEAMKIIFTDPVVENLVTDTELMSMFLEDNNVQTETSTGGRYIETAQYFRLPAGVGFRAVGANEYIPEPDAPLFVNSKVYLKKLHAVIEMTGDTMELVKGNPGAYLDWMERAMKDILTRMYDTVDRALLGYGNGAKARIEATWNGASTTIPVDRTFGITGWGNSGLAFLEGERIVASVDADGNPLRTPGAGQDARVTDVNIGLDGDLSTITVDAVPAAWAVDDFLFAGDGAGASTQTAAGVDREIMGLAGMVDDGSILGIFQNIDRSSYRLWQGIVVDGTAGEFTDGKLTEDVLTFADDRVAVLGGGKPNFAVMSRKGARSYWKALRQDRQLVDPQSYTGGKGQLYIRLGDRMLPLKVCRKQPDEVAYLLETSSFRRWQVDNGKWIDRTGAVWNVSSDATGRKDSYWANFVWYCQTGNVLPRHNVRIATESATV